MVPQNINLGLAIQALKGPQPALGPAEVDLRPEDAAEVHDDHEQRSGLKVSGFGG